jgi:NAD(P)-dependent dehydrogenase (short-subunit alcohol dehydrogenase family)
VNIVTINRMGMVGMAHSGAARAGVKNLSQSLGAEWGKYNVVINNVAPGTIHSDTAQVF